MAARRKTTGRSAPANTSLQFGTFLVQRDPDGAVEIYGAPPDKPNGKRELVHRFEPDQWAAAVAHLADGGSDEALELAGALHGSAADGVHVKEAIVQRYREQWESELEALAADQQTMQS